MCERAAVQWRAVQVQCVDECRVILARGQQNGQPLRSLHPGTQFTKRHVDPRGAQAVRSCRPQLMQAPAVILAVHVQEA